MAQDHVAGKPKSASMNQFCLWFCLSKLFPATPRPKHLDQLCFPCFCPCLLFLLLLLPLLTRRASDSVSAPYIFLSLSLPLSSSPYFHLCLFLPLDLSSLQLCQSMPQRPISTLPLPLLASAQSGSPTAINVNSKWVGEPDQHLPCLHLPLCLPFLSQPHPVHTLRLAVLMPQSLQPNQVLENNKTLNHQKIRLETFFQIKSLSLSIFAKQCFVVSRWEWCPAHTSPRANSTQSVSN